MNDIVSNTAAKAKLDSKIKEKASLIRQKAIQNLDQYLVEFETAYQKGRGKIYWAYNDDDAFQYLIKIIEATEHRNVVLNNGPLLKELKLNDRIGNRAHINELDGVSNNQDYSYITGAVFFSADFPSAFLNSQGASKHFANQDASVVLLVSIDQLVASIVDINSLAQIVSVAQTDTFELVSLLSKNRLHVIIVDNGRSGLLGKSPQNKLLEIGHPNYFKLKQESADDFLIDRLYHKQLENDTAPETFCTDGYTEKSLALDIPINDIIVANREAKAEKAKSDGDLIWRTWKSAMLNRKVLNRSNLGLLSLMKSFYKRGFGSLRSFPKVEKGSSFSEKWVKERPDVVESRKLTDIPKGQLLVRKPATDGLND